MDTLQRELNQIDGIAQKELVDAKKISQAELTTHYIKQIERWNPKLNAVVHTMFDEALEYAEKGINETSTFSGMPFLIKDLNAVKGHPTTSGSKMMRGHISPQDDGFVQRYRSAGLNFLGKTNTPEFGFLPTTESSFLGIAKNPWNQDLSPGGSSGGAGAAVAAGMIPFAHGSDGGGSIRIPASSCGVFGFKPSRGQVPYSPYMNNYGVNHALTRSVRDSAALLDIVRGKGFGEIYPSLPQSESMTAAAERTPGKLKIGITPDWDGRVKVPEEIHASIKHTAKLLEELGHEVEIASPSFDFDAMADYFVKIWMVGGSVVIKHMAAMQGVHPGEDNLETLTHRVFLEGQQFSATDYEEAKVLSEFEAKKFHAFHQKYDILVTPVLNRLPVAHGELAQKHEPKIDMMYNFTDYCSFTPIANMTGQPAMSMPLCWTADNVPVGVQFTGRLGEDALLYQLASQIEQAQPWFHRYQQLQSNFA
ncbi:amidase [Thalassobacillus hwangdonensis]|uniref:Amidase n=1 Tax=Thalassobacillus hwangdonensis TaxID=546108 RepID=A0ABW3L401_9BACI